MKTKTEKLYGETLEKMIADGDYVGAAKVEKEIAGAGFKTVACDACDRTRRQKKTDDSRYYCGCGDE